MKEVKSTLIHTSKSNVSYFNWQCPNCKSVNPHKTKKIIPTSLLCWSCDELYLVDLIK